MDQDKSKAMEDPFSRLDYRRLIAWPERIRREAPFLKRVLAAAPDASVLDLGCGTGEHSRFFAGEGCRVVGLDRSESMIQQAEEEPQPPNLKFVLGDIQDVGERVTSTFGLVISLGNTLVNITEDDELQRALLSIHKLVQRGGLFLIQILNYERIIGKKIRYLPLNFREGGDGEIVFLRLMEDMGNGRILFCPTTLTYSPHRDPPVEVERSRVVEVRGWRRPEMMSLLQGADFEIDSICGDMVGGPYDPEASGDLVILARKVLPTNRAAE